jgi:hypothetical protein
VAAGTAALPVTVFFATTVEIHGVFFLPCSIAWFLAARCATAPSFSAAALLGSATALAGLTHSSGHIMLPLLAAFVVVQGIGSAGPRILWGTLPFTAVAHVAVTLAVRAALGHGSRSPLAYALAEWPRLFAVQHLPAHLALEYLLPTFPFGAAALWLVLRQRCALYVVHALIVLSYAQMTVVVSWNLREFGAYGVPLVFPAVCLPAAHYGRRAAGWLTALAAAGAVTLLVVWSKQLSDPIDVAAVQELAQEGRTALLVFDRNESDPVLRVTVDIPVFHIPVFLRAYPGPAAQQAQNLLFAVQFLARGGHAVYTTDKSMVAFAQFVPDVVAQARTLLRFTPRTVRGVNFVRLEAQ